MQSVAGIGPCTVIVFVNITGAEADAEPAFVPPHSYGYLTYFANRIWFSAGIAGAPGTWIAEYDPNTGNTSTLRIRGKALSQFGDQPAAAGADSLWLRTSDGVVSRIDPHTGHRLATYPADPDGGGGFLTVAYNSLWIANFGSDTLWRVRIDRSRR